MKKPLLLVFTSCLLLCANNSRTDLILKWSSFITQDHPAVVGENQPDSRFGISINSADNVLYIGSTKYVHSNTIESGAVHKLVGSIDKPFGTHPHN